MTRREARGQALCLVFEKMFQNEPIPDIVRLAIEAESYDPDPFSEKLAAGVFEHIAEIDAVVDKYTIGWTKNRLAKVVLSILRLAVYEMTYEKDTPVSVAINEAVELAKKYAGDGDAALINGVLGTYAREVLHDESIKPASKEKTGTAGKNVTAETGPSGKPGAADEPKPENAEPADTVGDGRKDA